MSVQTGSAAVQAASKSLDGNRLRIGIVVARFNAQATDGLLAGASEVLATEGLSAGDIDVVYVPGSFELPLAASKLAGSGRYDAVICLGAIIKHETRHDEFIASAVANGITRAALDTGVPIVFGVLTTENEEQAIARSSGEGNRGRDAARTAVEMARLLSTIS
jgi:6,7-dimethyl-8-ribityllumazine synthase